MTSALKEIITENTLCLIDQESARVYSLEKPVNAWNVVGTFGDLRGQNRALCGQVDPAHAQSVEADKTWIHFWKSNTGNGEKPNPTCSFSGCSRQSNHGGHIYLQRQGGKWLQGENKGKHKYCYIAPICRYCNDPGNDDRRIDSRPRSTLKPDTLVVRILMSQETLGFDAFGRIEDDFDDERCERCGKKISNQPDHHYLCYQCWPG